MGCFWSRQASSERCRRCGNRGDKNSKIIDHLCENCIPKATRIELEAIRPSIFQNDYLLFLEGKTVEIVLGGIGLYGPFPIATLVQRSQACYGEYRCVCGRYWTSKQSWIDKWQKCKLCKKPVKAHFQRELTPNDWVKENVEKHERELCEMCLQLGSACRAFKTKTYSTQKKPYSARRVTSSARKTYPTRKITNSFRTKTYTSRTRAHRKW